MGILSRSQKSLKTTELGLHIDWSKWQIHNGDTICKNFDYRSEDGPSFELSIQTHFSFRRGIMNQTFFVMEHSRNIGFATGFYVCQLAFDSTAPMKTAPTGNTVTLKSEALEDGRVLFTTNDSEASECIRAWFTTGEDLLVRIFSTPMELILMLPIPNDKHFQKHFKTIMKSSPERGIENVIADLMR